MALQGKWSVITGGSSGIGRAIALDFVKMKSNILLLARDTDKLNQVAREVATAAPEASSVVVQTISVDLMDMDALKAAAAEVRSVVGADGVHILVNNAGYAYKGSVLDADLDRWLQLLDLNVKAVMALTRLLAPAMTSSDGGAIIVIGSDMALKWGPGQAAYCTTKAAVLGFCRCVYEDMREYGVKVCCVMPGIVNTPLQAGRSGIKFEYCIQESDIANIASFIALFPGTACPTEIVVEPQRSPYNRS